MNRKEKILKRLKQLGQNPNWLARKIDRPKQSVYQWIEGANPRDADVVWPAIARVLGLRDHRVLFDDALDLPDSLPDEVLIASPDEVTEPVKRFLRGDYALLPTWQTVLAGADGECAFVDPDSVHWEEIPALFVGNDLDRCVLCIASGTSMSPRIRQGDKIVVRLDPAPPRNTLVIAENPERLRYVKVLREKDGRLELHSVNERFKPIKDLKDWSLVGCVTAILGTYDGGAANIEWDSGRALRG